MIMNRGVLSVLSKLRRDALVAKTVRITHLNDPSLSISLQKNILPIFQAADLFFKNGEKLASFPTNFIYKHARSRVFELLFHHLDYDKVKIWTFALFLDTKNQQTKVIFLPIMSLFISTLSTIDYEAKNKPKECEERLGCGKRVSC